MFTHYRTQGLVLKIENRGEADQLITVFTKEFGRVEVLAKAVRKIKSKLRAGINLFYCSEIAFIQGRIYKILTDAVLIDKFPGLRKNLKTLPVAFKIADIFDKLITGQEQDEELWRLFEETFNRLNGLEPGVRETELLYKYFLWQFLSILGYAR